MTNHPQRRSTDRPREMMRNWGRLAFTVAAGLALVYGVLLLIGSRL
jgi:hypothetical protein